MWRVLSLLEIGTRTSTKDTPRFCARHPQLLTISRDQWPDFNGGQVLIRSGQQAGLAGISFWSHDLGGFCGEVTFADDATLEYHVRSFQWGLLSPLARAHGAAATPWDRGPQAEAGIAKFLKLRYRLLPTIYSYAWQSHRTGQPMMRAMVLDNQDDPNCYAAEFQYMFGLDLLVGPIYQLAQDEATAGNHEKDLTATRQVYLPEGQWYDYWTDNIYPGRQVLTCTAPLDTIPLFVRSGAVLAYGPETLRADTVPSDLEVHVYSGNDGCLTLYEDDGLSYAYQAGEFAETTIRLTDDGRKLSLVIGPTSGEYKGQADHHKWNIVVHGLNNCSYAKINGQPIDPSAFDRDARRFSTQLKISLYGTVALDVHR